MSGVSRSEAKSDTRHPRSGVQTCVAVLNERQRSRPSWEQAALAVCVTIQLLGTKADGVADTAQKRLGSAKQCLDTAFLSERSELRAGGGGSRSLRILSERSELGAGEGGSRSLRDHWASWHQSGRRSRHRT